MSKTSIPKQDQRQAPWNKGRLIGQKRPLKPKEVWNIRARLQIDARRRDLAMFNLAIDSKLRGCDLVRLKIDDLCVGGRLRDRATIIEEDRQAGSIRTHGADSVVGRGLAGGLKIRWAKGGRGPSGGWVSPRECNRETYTHMTTEGEQQWQYV